MKHLLIIWASIFLSSMAFSSPKECSVTIWNDQLVPLTSANGVFDIESNQSLELVLKEGINFTVKRIDLGDIGVFVELKLRKGDVSAFFFI